ncbi:MAG: hypothetical protein IH957_10180 [Chloroflexi bacterium]|nr:hypothetical protein [Chloroflexota bacterium]
MAPEDDRKAERAARMQAGVIVGYIAMIFGLLFTVSQASEATAWPFGVSASIVLLHMVGGYVLGWLAQPLLARLFTNS